MIERKIKMLLAYCGMTQSELAIKLGMSPQNFSQKIKRNSFTYEDLEKIAAVCGVTWKAYFETETGQTI